MRPKLSLIIPVYNAGSFIEKSIQKLENWINEQSFLVEVLFIDDGSTDESVKIIEPYCLKIEAIRLVSFSKNRGKGYVVKRGMLLAKGEFRIFTDADIPYGFEIINTTLTILQDENYDICVGNRKDTASDYHVKSSFIRTLTSKAFTTFISTLVINGLGDTQCGVKGFSENAAEILFPKLKINGFAFDVETLYLSYKFKLRIKRIPVNFEGNSISTINLASSSVRMFLDVLSLPLRYHFLKSYKD